MIASGFTRQSRIELHHAFPFISAPEGRAASPLSRRMRNAIRSGLRLAEVRLRIPIVLLISAIVVGRWDVIRNYWDRLTHVVLRQNSATSPVSNDTEYFCPMDPGVVSSWPGKCGVCNMDLVRRKRGEATALPDGVVARMQISPYRVQLAGIRTAPLSYRGPGADLPLGGNRSQREATDCRATGDPAAAGILAEGVRGRPDPVQGCRRFSPDRGAAAPSTTGRRGRGDRM